MAFLPRMDPTDPDGALFSSYPFSDRDQRHRLHRHVRHPGCRAGRTGGGGRIPRQPGAACSFPTLCPGGRSCAPSSCSRRGIRLQPLFVSGLAVQGVFFGTAALFPICAAPAHSRRPGSGSAGAGLLFPFGRPDGGACGVGGPAPPLGRRCRRGVSGPGLPAVPAAPPDLWAARPCWRDACFSLPYLRRWPQRI